MKTSKIPPSLTFKRRIFGSKKVAHSETEMPGCLLFVNSKAKVDNVKDQIETDIKFEGEWPLYNNSMGGF